MKALMASGYNESVYTISKAYYTRVEADGGTVENKPCLENELLTII